MTNIFRALRQSFKTCLDPRVLFLLFTPFLLALLVGLILFFTVGTWWIASASSGFENSVVMKYLSENWGILDADGTAAVSYFLMVIVAILVILPVSYLLAILIVSLVLLPFLLKILDQKGFHILEKKHGGSFSYSLWNTLKVSTLYVFGLLLTLPLWLFPGFAVLLPVLLTSYLNKNIFVHDVLEEYASREERQQIEKEHRKSLYVLGVILGLFNYIPLAFVVVPTFASLAYSYFCLNALKDLREDSL